MPVVFQPQTIEITKKLDLTGLGDSEAEALRRKLYAPESVESIIQRVVGPSVDARARIIIILWARFGEFVQSLARADQTGLPGPTQTEEITTHYRVS
jgi:hypothetical protein